MQGTVPTLCGHCDTRAVVLNEHLLLFTRRSLRLCGVLYLNHRELRVDKVLWIAPKLLRAGWAGVN